MENQIISIIANLLADYDDSDLAFIEEQNLTFGDMGLAVDQELCDGRYILEVGTKVEWATATDINQTFIVYSLVLWDDVEGDCLVRVSLDSISDEELLRRLFDGSQVDPAVQLGELRSIMLEARAFDDDFNE